ncbi:hypothetical protein LOC68_27460 [Blastopirellula sp. JC732]|uniref:PilN domain-containing protein n=1 Tax=Blastopirellula sediminis TaxID=2894196 RepID=A0A9X1MTJ5_9BACT|nr:hypothetical protein [Blastopirellula sediminis]MCC9604551.1 hypothetical protein [Blastopirellula sediminis]MCC9632150.1 hypothetical protein [Blastopirellula sediminis]
MQDIDFLPKKFRDRRNRRRANVYRWVGAAGIGVLLAVAALLQLGIQHQLKAHRNRLEAQYLAAVAKRDQLVTLQSKLTEHRNEAQLYAALRSHWPATQLLVCITAPTPESLSFRELKMYQEIASVARRREEEEEANATAKAPTLRDFEFFRSERKARTAKIDVDGDVMEVSELYEYLVKLNDHPLIQRAIIESVEPVAHGDDSGRSEFQLQVVLTPPPGADAVPAATTASR